MIFYCPRYHFETSKCAAGEKVIYQPSKLSYWCPRCNGSFTLREVALVGAWKPAVLTTEGPGT